MFYNYRRSTRNFGILVHSLFKSPEVVVHTQPGRTETLGNDESPAGPSFSGSLGFVEIINKSVIMIYNRQFSRGEFEK